MSCGFCVAESGACFTFRRLAPACSAARARSYEADGGLQTVRERSCCLAAGQAPNAGSRLAFVSRRQSRRFWWTGLAVAAVAAWLLLRNGPEGNDASMPDKRPTAADEARQPIVLAGRANASAGTGVAPTRLSEPAVGAPAPAKGYVIEGIVKDVATQAPVLGAEVIGMGWTAPIPSHSAERRVRAESMGGGRFRFDVEGSPPVLLNAFELADVGWQVIWSEEDRSAAAHGEPLGHAEGSPFVSVSAEPGKVNRITLWVRRAFRLRGIVQDEGERPLPGVLIKYYMPEPRAREKIVMRYASRESGTEGTFNLGPFAADPRVGGVADVRLRAHATFTHPGFAPLRIDPLDVPEGERDRAVLTMTRGVTLAGTLVEPNGEPLANASVEVEYEGARDLRRSVRTDADGRWRMENLAPGKTILTARVFARDLKTRRDIDLVADHLDVRLMADAIRFTRIHPTIRVLGLALAAADDELREAYDVPSFVNIVVLDPSADLGRLGLEHVERGCGIWMIGQQPVTSLLDVVGRLIDVASAADEHVRGRIQFTGTSEAIRASSNRQVRLTAEQIAELRVLRDRLAIRGDR